MLREACRSLAGWQRNNPRTAPEQVCVNFSACELGHPDVVEIVAEALADAGLPPAALCV